MVVGYLDYYLHILTPIQLFGGLATYEYLIDGSNLSNCYPIALLPTLLPPNSKAMQRCQYCKSEHVRLFATNSIPSRLERPQL